MLNKLLPVTGLLCLMISIALAQSDSRYAFDPNLDYQIGRAIFEKIWVSSPSSTTASDGLGPLYNARSCASCHQNGGRGSTENSLVLHIDDEFYGEQLQAHGVSGIRREADVSVHYSDFKIELGSHESVVLSRPEYSVTVLQSGDAPAAFSPRVASSLAGLGMLALIPEQSIASLADAEDRDSDGISGRMNRVWNSENQKEELGRFGWKSAQSSLRQQTAKAFSLDLGIGTEAYPDAYGDCSEQQQLCRDMPNGNSVQHDGQEASKLMLDSLLFYVSNIPAPAEVDDQSPAYKKGLEIFKRASCDSCHNVAFTTNRGVIKPFSDLLLHDMGDSLEDGFASGSLNEGLATGREWRTAPLWGVGQANEYLHDGRAKSLQEAILWHGGEAKMSVSRYKSMEKNARDDLISFLNEL